MATADVDDDLIATFRDEPGRSGVFCDFDGTLAEIIDAADQAKPVDGAVEALSSLAEVYARVAVISGRPARFLQEHLGGRGLILSGLYGLERVDDDGVHVAEEAQRWQSVVTEVTDRARDTAPDGLVVEPKGLSVTLHFRTTPELAGAAEEWVNEQAEETGLVVSPGRQSFELRPPVTASKGTVVAEAADGLGAACFLGDDHGDLTAFDALDELAGAGVTVMRVAVRSDESPPELLDRADVVVDGPDEVVRLLRRLLPEPSEPDSS
ncbi:MAG TPA: trehalose-phosphatase [Acidimicrobiales bacterium]|nr:trehalose-phosphatase [Acidimicrobiales bacterium]